MGVMSAIAVSEGSGNVFADLGLPNPEEELAKSETCIEIYHRLEELRLTPAQAAERVGLSERDVEEIIAGRFGRFSLERLIRCLNSLGEDVEIVFRRRKSPAGQGQLSVTRVPVAA